MSSAYDQAYDALRKAADRIADNAYRAGLYKVKRRKGKVVEGYRLTEEHARVLSTLDALSRKRITPDEAMSVLHEYEVVGARTESRAQTRVKFGRASRRGGGGGGGTMPQHCRTALSSCMKGARSGSGTPRACMVRFNQCRKG